MLNIFHEHRVGDNVRHLTAQRLTIWSHIRLASPAMMLNILSSCKVLGAKILIGISVTLSENVKQLTSWMKSGIALELIESPQYRTTWALQPEELSVIPSNFWRIFATSSIACKMHLLQLPQRWSLPATASVMMHTMALLEKDCKRLQSRWASDALIQKSTLKENANAQFADGVKYLERLLKKCEDCGTHEQLSPRTKEMPTQQKYFRALAARCCWRQQWR